MVSTGRLLKTDSVWVASKQDARKFADTGAAINYCLSHGIEGVRFVLSEGDARMDEYMDVFGAERRWHAAQINMG